MLIMIIMTTTMMKMIMMISHGIDQTTASYYRRDTHPTTPHTHMHTANKQQMYETTFTILEFADHDNDI